MIVLIIVVVLLRGKNFEELEKMWVYGRIFGPD